jgi:formyltetrahydrofolate-dependent phosphoribosylglycinamide formyltransferase
VPGDRFRATITGRLSCAYDWEPPLSELISVRPDVPARLVVLVSGSGTLLQAVLDAADLPVRVVAVGADRPGIEGLARAERAGVPGFVVRLKDHPDRAEWDRALTKAVAAHEPDLVVSAGFMKILGPEFLTAFGGRIINTHPALLPAFPGAHAVTDAISYGVRVTGCTVHLVDAGVDTGPIVAQEAVSVTPGEDVDALHERIKVVERRLLVDVIALLTRQGYTVHGRKVSIP